MHRAWFSVSALLVLLALTASGARAQAPEMLSHQGVLTLSNGTVVPDGLYGVRFSVWDASSAGNAQFEQTLQVQVKDGLYNVLLTNQAGWSLATAFGGSPRYMEVAITSVPAGSGLAPPITLTPRQQVASVPYALVAKAVDSQPPSASDVGFVTSLYKSSPQALPRDTWTAVDFDQELLDQGEWHSASTNTARITVTSSGTYQIIGTLAFSPNSTGTRWTAIQKTHQQNPQYLVFDTRNAVGSGSPTIVNVTTIDNAQAGDFYELMATQDSGGPLSFQANDSARAHFIVTRLE